MADVNGDGVKDLVSGSTDGRLFAFLNVGSTFAPVWSASVELSGVDGALDLEGTQRSRPFACDYNSDGATDLLVGASDGAVRYFRSLRSAALDASGIPGAPFVYSVDWVAGNVYLTAELGSAEYVVQEDCMLNVGANVGDGLSYWWDVVGSSTGDAENFVLGTDSLWVDAGTLNVDENGETTVRLLVKDWQSASAPTLTTVRVVRVAPTVSIEKTSFANEQILRLNFEAFFPNGRTGLEWTLNWGDGTEPETFRCLGDAMSAAHVYSTSPETRTYAITLTLVDNKGFGGETSYVVAEHVVPGVEIGKEIASLMATTDSDVVDPKTEKTGDGDSVFETPTVTDGIFIDNKTITSDGVSDGATLAVCNTFSSLNAGDVGSNEQIYDVSQHLSANTSNSDRGNDAYNDAENGTAFVDSISMILVSKAAPGFVARVEESGAFNVNAYGAYATTLPTASSLAKRARMFAEALRIEFEEGLNKQDNIEFDALAATVLEANERANMVDPFKAAFSWAFHDDKENTLFDF